MKKKILIAMSGGVDSSVTAALLQEEGHEVGGATIRTWAPNDCSLQNTRACCGLSGVEDAQNVAEKLGIPYWVFNFEKEFKSLVVDYFADEYKKGRTPNPCVACNEHIKFRLFLKRAQLLGYDYIATGHYAQIIQESSSGSFFITEGADQNKDQSYVLFPLGKELLPNILLPIGAYTKPQIRQKARELDLCVMDKPDSQEICFIPSNDYGEFLNKKMVRENDPTLPKEKGLIKTREGKVMGEHEGYYRYTRGQRRGLGVAHQERLYVLDTDPANNEVIVGYKEDIKNQICRVARMNWFISPEPGTVFEAFVKIRAQHEKAKASVRIVDGRTVEINFCEPQEAITPGQGAVIYAGNRVLGGGWIESFHS